MEKQTSVIGPTRQEAPPEATPLRVLFVVDSLWVGGTERSLAEMLPHLEAAGIEAKVACLRSRHNEGVEELVLDQGIDVRVLTSEGFFGKARDLRRLLLQERPHIVHSALFQSNLATRLAAPGTGAVVLNSLVNTPYDPVRRKDPRLRAWRLRVVQILDALTGRLLVDHFHAVSHATEAAALRSLRLSPRRVTVVQRGRDPDRLGEPSAERRHRARQALALAEDAEVVVNTGRHEFQKGQEVLLEAVAQLRSRRPRTVLLIAGRHGGTTAQLERLIARLGLDEAVQLLGHREDVPEILAAADLFAFPSLCEGFPGAVLEAMALGLPVVASDIPPIREIVDAIRTGILVEPGNPTLLAKAMGDLLEDPGRGAAYGEAGRKVFEKRFTLKASTRRMAEMYNDLCPSTRGQTNRRVEPRREP